MTAWRGTIVGRVSRAEGLKNEPVYLIMVDNGDRIWRYESELTLVKEEKGVKRIYKTGGKHEN